MRVGQTSFIVFISKLLGSVLGFLATLTFARILGADVIGYYSIALAVIAWLKLGGDLGVSQAVSKRISEADDPDEYYTAGLITIGAFVVAISLVVLILRDAIDSYIGVHVWHFVIPLAVTGLLITLATSTLNGERKVHISGLLTPVNLTITSITQIALVLAGFKLTGMLFGYLVGEFLIGITAIAIVSSSIRLPEKQHFKRLYDFAKYSWLGSLKLRSFNDIDVLVLGALVSPSLVGVYTVAWSLSKFLTLFGGAVRSAMFPEVSHADASGDSDRIKNLTEDSLSFIGLIAIPGLFGGVILGDRLLRIYGDEFTQGTTVLGILILATLIYSYQQQMLGIIKGIDRPKIAFKINAVFIVLNFTLNVLLVLWIGWVGAALATAVSAFFAAVLAYRALKRLVEFDSPIREPAYQVFAACVMAVVVYAARSTIEASTLPKYNAVLVVVLVGFGATVYFTVLIGVSGQFRDLLSSNAPITLPF
ncbi:Membrane protein involved in the export of O-antigen and teichoic acid [Halopenitus malekzadehii]|uniref:Membrane protein involved in the export of O-antigen and teichoic acid n=1 Tax=Halopenitus malekzadehii TaxID=1267564 RepID=A0A1H6IGM7_9EURY|nr:flippase [Halopenitus malekzadehii]SEH46356.1 Membrane protein involved in the export of O-antigen and teichoic acid [Halopenitus malekzadehii]